MIKVINIHKEKNYSQTNYVYVGRKHILGNPFVLQKESDRQKVIKQYRKWLINIINKKHSEKYIAFLKIVDKAYQLKQQGKVLILGCHCKPKACHADTLKEQIEKAIQKKEQSQLLC